MGHKDSTRPMVSCIMPTRNRRRFVPRAIRYFLNQDYPDGELLIIDDGEESVADLIPRHGRIRCIKPDRPCSLGAKRNLACEQAKGGIIVHWDDDDWLASWRLRYQVEQLLKGSADICGLDRLFYFDPWSKQAWEYHYPRRPSTLLAGGSLCYYKRIWRQWPFSEIDLGEDSAFLQAHKDKAILALENNLFYAALNHEQNTNPRNTTGPAWRTRPYAQLLAMLGNDQEFYNELVKKRDMTRPAMEQKTSTSNHVASPAKPLVSCIMMTRDRPDFVSQSIQYFLRQDYPNKELVVVDDGTRSAREQVPDDPAIRYIRLERQMSLGQKRNLAVKESHGGFIAHWDDDDWYGPSRISSQLAALRSGGAKICGLNGGVIYDISRDRYWTVTPDLHGKMYYADIHGRSIMYSRDVWEKYARYPDRSLGEDAGFLKSALSKGASLARLENDGHLIYIRHGQNTWEFRCGYFIDPAGWRTAAPPPCLSEADRAFYRQHPRARRGHTPITNIARLPSTAERNLSDCHVTVAIPYYGCAATLRRAVESILGQTHPDLTLVVVNDGDTPPWDLLEDIDDPRLVCFDLTANHGRYFADAVVLNATRSPYYLVQDADDWSEPDRIAVLLRRLRAEHAAGAISAEYVHKNTAANIEHYHALHESLDDAFRHRANHHGLYRTAALRSIGGYYGGFRMGYDTLLVNLLQMTGRLAYVDKPYYHRLMRADSLSNATSTGMQSGTRQQVIQSLGRMYSEAYRAYQDYVCGEQDYAQLCRRIRATCQQHITAEQRAALELETDRLRRQLQQAEAAKSSPVKLSSPAVATAALADDPRLPWTGWSLDKAFAQAMIATLEARPPECILEAGAGATTFLLAEFAARSGARFVSLEHDAAYYQKIKTLLDELGLLRYVDLRLAPLRPYRCADGRDYPWYATDLTDRFDFVLLDGPPERDGRQAGMFALQSCLADNWSIWLHDGNRPHEKACVALWQAHYPFISALSQADPKGVFCINSPRGTAALLPDRKPYSSGIGIALLTGDRPALLRQTVESFSEHYPDILETSAVVAMVNGRDPEAESYLQDLSFVDSVLSYPHEVLPIGAAAGYLARTLARLKGVEFIFHLEDDWLTTYRHEGWWQQAQDILHAFPDIGQVRIRHQSESVLSRNMATQEPMRWVEHKGFRFSPEAHFTFNPNLMRAADLDKVYPSRTEYEAQLKFHQAGLSGAQLLPGCFQHIGTRQSRRIRIENGIACA